MEDALKRKDRIAAVRIVVIYAGFAALWIYFSDTALGLVVMVRASLVRFAVL